MNIDILNIGLLFIMHFFQVLGSNNEFHFIHSAVPSVRSKRSVLHTRKLKADPLVSLILLIPLYPVSEVDGVYFTPGNSRLIH